MALKIELFNSDLASPVLLDVLTGKADRLRFSTGLPGGFRECSFNIKADLPTSFDWVLNRIFSRILITDVTSPLGGPD
jgi:hypothetical protein